MNWSTDAIIKSLNNITRHILILKLMSKVNFLYSVILNCNYDLLDPLSSALQNHLKISLCKK